MHQIRALRNKRHKAKKVQKKEWMQAFNVMNPDIAPIENMENSLTECDKINWQTYGRQTTILNK